MDQLKTDIVNTEVEHGHCEYIEGSDTYTQTELEATVEAAAVKHKRRDSMSLVADRTQYMAVISEDNNDRQIDLENDFIYTIVKTEQNYYEDNIANKTEMINDYDSNYCNDKTNCDVSNDGYSSDSTLVLDIKPDIEELSDQMQNSCMENTHNLDMSCNPNAKQIINGNSKAQNNTKIEADRKFDIYSTKRKKKLQDKLEFEPTPNFILCDDIINRSKNDEFLVKSLIPKREINEDESSNFWETNVDENNLLVKRLGKLRKSVVGLYCCTECDYKCKLKISLTMHMKTHKEDKYFSCDRCTYKSKLRHGLNLHMQQKHTDVVVCDLCNSTFKNSDDLFRHTKIHYGENSYSCHLCVFETLDTDNFVDHLRKHTGKKTYICQHCDQKFSSYKHMSLHTKGNNCKTKTREKYSNSDRDVETQNTVLKTSRNVSENKRHACELCESKFVLKSHLTRHMKTHSGEKPFVCDICEQKFSQKGDLKKHMFIHTGKRPSACDTCPYKRTSNIDMLLHTKGKISKTRNRNVKTQVSVLNETESEKRYACNRCTSKFTRKGDLTRHMRTHSSDSPFVCHICKQNFKTNATLKKHVSFRTGEKPYTCQLCDRKFCFKKILKKHMWDHTREKYTNSDRDVKTQKTVPKTNRNVSEKMKHACELCDSKFVLKGHLTRHMKTHSGEKTFVCHICEQKFSQKGGLKKHMFIHTGERPFACDTCPYKCTSKIDLVKHKMTHTGEKPYACTYCDFRCNRSYSLITHTRAHTGEKPFSCKLCAYKCTRTSQLVRHMRTHTGEKRFSCGLCDFKCTRHCNLQMHMRIHTGDMLCCDYCSYKTTNKACLIIHITRHMKQIDVNKVKKKTCGTRRLPR